MPCEAPVGGPEERGPIWRSNRQWAKTLPARRGPKWGPRGRGPNRRQAEALPVLWEPSLGHRAAGPQPAMGGGVANPAGAQMRSQGDGGPAGDGQKRCPVHHAYNTSMNTCVPALIREKQWAKQMGFRWGRKPMTGSTDIGGRRPYLDGDARRANRGAPISDDGPQPTKAINDHQLATTDLHNQGCQYQIFRKEPKQRGVRIDLMH